MCNVQCAIAEIAEIAELGIAHWALLIFHLGTAPGPSGPEPRFEVH
jgi:hypothetical protein